MESEESEEGLPFPRTSHQNPVKSVHLEDLSGIIEIILLVGYFTALYQVLQRDLTVTGLAHGLSLVFLTVTFGLYIEQHWLDPSAVRAVLSRKSYFWQSLGWSLLCIGLTVTWFWKCSPSEYDCRYPSSAAPPTHSKCRKRRLRAFIPVWISSAIFIYLIIGFRLNLTLGGSVLTPHGGSQFTAVVCCPVAWAAVAAAASASVVLYALLTEAEGRHLYLGGGSGYLPKGQLGGSDSPVGKPSSSRNGAAAAAAGFLPPPTRRPSEAALSAAADLRGAPAAAPLLRAQPSRGGGEADSQVSSLTATPTPLGAWGAAGPTALGGRPSGTASPGPGGWGARGGAGGGPGRPLATQHSLPAGAGYGYGGRPSETDDPFNQTFPPVGGIATPDALQSALANQIHRPSQPSSPNGGRSWRKMSEDNSRGPTPGLRRVGSPGGAEAWHRLVGNAPPHPAGGNGGGGPQRPFRPSEGGAADPAAPYDRVPSFRRGPGDVSHLISSDSDGTGGDDEDYEDAAGGGAGGGGARSSRASSITFDYFSMSHQSVEGGGGGGGGGGPPSFRSLQQQAAARGGGGGGGGRGGGRPAPAHLDVGWANSGRPSTASHPTTPTWQTPIGTTGHNGGRQFDFDSTESESDDEAHSEDEGSSTDYGSDAVPVHRDDHLGGGRPPTHRHRKHVSKHGPRTDDHRNLRRRRKIPHNGTKDHPPEEHPPAMTHSSSAQSFSSAAVSSAEEGGGGGGSAHRPGHGGGGGPGGEAPTAYGGGGGGEGGTAPAAARLRAPQGFTAAGILQAHDEVTQKVRRHAEGGGGSAVADAAGGASNGSGSGGWVEYYDEGEAAPYWYNETTGESSWENPVHAKAD